jgi:hypothetical protein
MGTRFVVLVSAALVACGGSGAPPQEGDATISDAPQPFEDVDVERIYTRMMTVMAPGSAWPQARYLAFDWVIARPDGEPVVRSHRWDRWEGRYRVEAVRDGKLMLALFDVGDPASGRVWLDGRPVTGEQAMEMLRQANAIYVNDSYWLIMPYKWRDPGVHARYPAFGRTTRDAHGRWSSYRSTPWA